MLDYITENLAKYETEDKMLQFLSEMGLPGALDSVISNSKNLLNLLNLLIRLYF